jgi:hypothetical protein
VLAGEYFCNMAVQLNYTDTCANACRSAGATCEQAWDDRGDTACVYSKEVSCDTSLHSKICSCASNVIA